MKRLTATALFLCFVLLITAGCAGPKAPSAPDDPSAPGGDWPPATTDTTFSDYKAGFEAEAVNGGYEEVLRDDTRSVYNAPEGAPSYEYSYRAYPLENGITRLLAYKYAYLEGDDTATLDVVCEVADFYLDKLIEINPIDAAPLAHFTVKSNPYLEPAMAYGWLDQNHVYLSGRSYLAIVNLLTGDISLPTADPEVIYGAAGSHESVYMAIVAEPYAMDGKLYYLSYRSPTALNTRGDIYEADVNGERLILQDVIGVAGVADGAIAYFGLPVGGFEDDGPNAERLFCYDVENGRDGLVFGDTNYELDEDSTIVGGVLLGNWWAGKQETYDHPPYIIHERQLFFYVSRIAEEKVDRYVYDIATGNLLLQATASASDYK